MAAMYAHNDELAIHPEANEPPYVFDGKFKKEDDDYIMIEGTVGDTIGREIIIPKRTIRYIEIMQRARKADDDDLNMFSKKERV